MRDWDSLPSVLILWKDITGCLSSWSYFKAVVLRFGILWVIHYFLIPTVKDIGLLCSHAREQCVLHEKQPGLNLWCSNILLPQNREGREALHGPSKGLSQINVRRFLGVGMKSDHPSRLSLWVLGLWDKSLFLRQPSQVTSSCCKFFFFFNETQGFKKKTKRRQKNQTKWKTHLATEVRSHFDRFVLPATCTVVFWAVLGKADTFGWLLLLHFYLWECLPLCVALVFQTFCIRKSCTTTSVALWCIGFWCHFSNSVEHSLNLR